MLQYYQMESKKVIVITPRKELIIVSSIVGLLAMSLIVPWNIPRAILGIPFVLFLPGYAFLSAIFPGKGKIDLLERLIISAGFSLVLVSLMAFVINYTPWGLRLGPPIHRIFSVHTGVKLSVLLPTQSNA